MPKNLLINNGSTRRQCNSNAFNPNCEPALRRLLKRYGRVRLQPVGHGGPWILDLRQVTVRF
ncbi:MAG TPA: hypothetical protein PL105_18055 [Caldilineaceae bacterium]|nr:hypothetical protein [Caldilineaceae bacterium]